MKILNKKSLKQIVGGSQVCSATGFNRTTCISSENGKVCEGRYDWMGNTLSISCTDYLN